MKKLLKIIISLILFFVIGMLAGHLTLTALSFSRSVTVPDLKGKSLIEASALVKEHGLYLRIEGEDFDAAASAGTVMRQDVPSGTSVKQGREIKVLLSKGARVKYIPDLVGQPLDSVEDILRAKGIKIAKIIYAHSDAVPKDTIIAQRPEANEMNGDAFSVIVSLGPFDPERSRKG